MKARPKSWKKFFNTYLPLTDWLFHYSLREDLMADIVAGITVAIMHIPQGMAYASLAETGPMVGIYTAVFPVAMYTLLGPSRHVSIGTNPLTSILVGSAVTSTLPEGGGSGGAGLNETDSALHGLRLPSIWPSYGGDGRAEEDDAYLDYSDADAAGEDAGDNFFAPSTRHPERSRGISR